MDLGSEKRLSLVWVALSAITLASLWLGSLEGRAPDRPDAAISCAAIAIALFKVRLVLREFMELRHAPAPLCRLSDAWLVFTGVALLGTYLVGTALASG